MRISRANSVANPSALLFFTKIKTSIRIQRLLALFVSDISGIVLNEPDSDPEQLSTNLTALFLFTFISFQVCRHDNVKSNRIH